MGKGDKKSKKGKISMGSFGVSRPSKSTLKKVMNSKIKEAVVAKPKPVKATEAPKPATPKPAPAKVAAVKTEAVKTEKVKTETAKPAKKAADKK
jgi:30S ribosomal protein S31